MLTGNQQEPSISGNGEKLAVIIDQQGRSTVQLRNLRSGGRIPLRHLYRHQPHTSPSLSWNGRYLAIITQQGNRRLAVIEDLLTGQIHRLPLRAERQPISLKISPDARKIAFELINQGKWQVEIFDLTKILEPDLPSGITRTTRPLIRDE